MDSAPSSIGRYQIREKIAQGRTGALYLGFDPTIDRSVAVKVLNVGDDEARRGFLRGARAVGRLQHPHIVTIYDVGEHEGWPFIAMEWYWTFTPSHSRLG